MKVLLISCGDVAVETGLRFMARGAQVTAWRRSPNNLPATFHGEQVDLASSQLPRIDPDTEIALFTPVPARRDVTGYQRAYLDTAQRVVAALAEQAPALRRLFYISSSAVNAGQGGRWVTEADPILPTRPTAEVLAQTEDFLLNSGLPVTVLRASGIYGPGRTRLMDILRSGSARIPADSHWTNRIHRDDLAKAVVHLAGLGEHIEQLYLATDNEPAQLSQVYRHVARSLGLELPIDDPLSSPRKTDRRLSNARLRATGWEPTFPNFRDGYQSIIHGSAQRHR